MAKPRTEAKPPVDAEDDDRRDPVVLAADRARITAETDVGVAAYGEATARSMAPSIEPSVQYDEHRGLAGKILDLRNAFEAQRVLGIQEKAQLNQRMAQLEQLASAIATRIDREVEEIGKTQRELGNALREGGEQVRVAGELGRKMTDQMRVLEELREMASDPHEVVKPILRAIAFLKGDVEALGRSVDIRFEQMPKARSQPIESRSADEDPIVKLGTEIRKLKDRVSRIEPD